MAELWSDYANGVISDIDADLGNKFGKLNLRKLLSDPTKFAAQPNVVSDAQKIKTATQDYFDDILDNLSDDKKRLDVDLAKADSVTSQLAGNISMQAKQNKLPIIKPALIERDLSRDVIIYIDSVDSGVTSLVEKLAANSMYVADNTVAYKGRKIGAWVFGGRKTHVLRVFLPQNQVVMLEGARDEINGLFDIAMNYLKSAKK